ncbi:MAG: hypothetical protein M3R24_13680 [Chloroflexota bacterium]|nr:hypothetical protein [Chloroflexota bacterium]
MSGRAAQRDAPTLRELLSRATWAELDRIAARYGIAFNGRRRELAVDRLASLLERPDQLQTAGRMLPPSTRTVLGLLMVLGSAEDEQALVAARERLLKVRPDLQGMLGRAHLPNEVQLLLSLGLCLHERRRLVVPAEVLRALPIPIPIALPGAAVEVPPQSYASLAYKLNLLLTLLGETAPVAVQTQRVALDRVTVYQPLLLTVDVAAELGQRLGVPGSEVVLLLALLEAIGAVAPVHGRWQVQAGWETLSSHPPLELLRSLVEAWQQPRILSDLSRTGEFVWRCGPESEGGNSIAQHEAMVRALLWRWLSGSGTEPLDVASLGAALAALHPRLFQSIDERETWITGAERGRVGSATTNDPGAVAQAVLRQLLQQLAVLGLIVWDTHSCRLTPLAVGMLMGQDFSQTPPRLESVGAAVVRVQPLTVSPSLLVLLSTAGRMLPPEGEYARYEIEPRGLVRLQERSIPVSGLVEAVAAAGAVLQPDFQTQLAAWAERAGRIKQHRPLTILLTAEDAPLLQILAAAGAAETAEVLGPGCALLEPDAVEAAVEQLRARGFWPTIRA